MVVVPSPLSNIDLQSKDTLQVEMRNQVVIPNPTNPSSGTLELRFLPEWKRDLEDPGSFLGFQSIVAVGRYGHD